MKLVYIKFARVDRNKDDMKEINNSTLKHDIIDWHHYKFLLRTHFIKTEFNFFVS